MRLKSLKKVLQKLGGTPADEKTCGAVIEKIADVAGGGGLEPATSDKLGGVKIGSGINVTEDGTISASGGESDVLVVNFTYPDDDIIADKTLDEIIKAAKSGKVVIGNYEGQTMTMNGYGDTEGYEYAGFEYFGMGDGADDKMLSFLQTIWTYQNDGTITESRFKGTFVAE